MNEPEDLLSRWRSGERDALDALIQRNLDWVRDYVHVRLGAHMRRIAETHDLVQETMVDLLTYGPGFAVADEDQFRAVLARMVENNIRDHHAWLGRARRSASKEAGQMSPSTLDRRLHDGSATTPSQAADRTDRHQWLQLAMRLADKNDREIIQLREFDRLSFVEVGKRLNISANTARMRFSRAVKRLTQSVMELMSAESRED